MANKINIVLEVDDRGTPSVKKFESAYEKAMREVGQSSKKASTTAASAFSRVKTSMAGLQSQALALGVAMTGLIYSANRLIASYIEQETVERKLANAMQLSGTYTKENFQSMLDYATALQMTTKYGDETTLSVMNLLQTYQLNNEEVKWATARALDFASALGIDANTAARYLGMALKGNIEMLARYIPALKSTITEELKHMTTTEKVRFAMEKLNEQFGGRAQAEMQTYGGRLTWLGNLAGDVGEHIGKSLLNAFVGENIAKADSNIKELGSSIVNMGEVASKAIFRLSSVFSGWATIFDFIKLAWIDLLKLLLAGYEKIQKVYIWFEKQFGDAAFAKKLEQDLSAVRQTLLELDIDKANAEQAIMDRGEAYRKGIIEIENSFERLRKALRKSEFQNLVPENFTLSVEEMPKKVEEATKKTEQVIETSAGKMTETTSQMADTMRDSLKDLFLHASEGDFDDFFKSITNKFKGFFTDLSASMMLNTVTSMLGLGQPIPGIGTLGSNLGGLNNIVGALSGLKDLFTTGDVSAQSAYKMGFIGPATSSGGFLSQALGGIQSVGGALSMVGGAFGAAAGGIGALAGIGMSIYGSIESSKAKRKEMRRMRGAEFADALQTWMNNEYDSIIEAIMGASGKLLSGKALHSARGEELVNVSEWATMWQREMKLIREEAVYTGDVTTGSFRRLANSMIKVSETSPLMKKQFEKMRLELQESFSESILEDFEEGLVDTTEAIEKMMGAGLDQLSAQTRLFGEDYNNLVLLMQGSIPVVGDTEQAFNDMREELKQFDDKINALPDKLGYVKHGLEVLSYAASLLVESLQGMTDMLEGLIELPGSFQALGEAISTGNWEQAVESLSNIEGTLSTIASTLSSVGDALSIANYDLAEYFAMLSSGVLIIYIFVEAIKLLFHWFMDFDDIVAKNNRTLLEFYKRVEDVWSEIGFEFKWLDKLIAKLESAVVEENRFLTEWDIFKEELADTSIADVISSVAEQMQDLSDAMMQISGGTLAFELDQIIEDFGKYLLELQRLRDSMPGFGYDDALSQAIEVYTDQIEKYFDVVLTGFKDLQTTIKLDIQSLSGGRTAADVVADMVGVGLGMEATDVTKDPQKWLSYATQMRDLVLERYAIERLAIAEQITETERLRDIYQNLADAIASKLLDIQTSGLNPQTAVERLDYLAQEAERLRGGIAGASDEEQAALMGQLADILSEQLDMAEQVYQRPSNAYQELYKSITAELSNLQTQAEEFVKDYDAVLVSLGEELNGLQQDTITALGFIDEQVSGARTALETLRDDYIALIKDDIGAIKDYLNPETGMAADIDSLNTNQLESNRILRSIDDRLHPLRTLSNFIRGLVGLQSGIDYVPRTMPAILHKGEAVITASENRRSVSVPVNITVNASGGGRGIIDDLKSQIKWGELGTAIEHRVRKIA